VSPLPRQRMARSPSRSMSRSRSKSRSPASPPRKRSVSRDRRGKGRRYSRSLSSSGSRRDDDKMDTAGKGGLKIKGQAEAQKRRSKWEDDGPQDVGALFAVILSAHAYHNLSRVPVVVQPTKKTNSKRERTN
jgi:serine/arginine repetitive matrix protein 1